MLLFFPVEDTKLSTQSGFACHQHAVIRKRCLIEQWAFLKLLNLYILQLPNIDIYLATLSVAI